MVLGVLLPYAVIEVPSMIFSDNQMWLFPFWYYVHDYGVWSEHGVFRFFPFARSELPFAVLGAMWFVLGLSTSILLRELYLGKIQRKLVMLLFFVALVSQVWMTLLVLLHVYIYTLNYVIPLPLHMFAVLLLAAIAPERNGE
jgi:hypothetical protein